MMFSTKFPVLLNDVNVPVNIVTNYVNPMILAWFRIPKIYLYPDVY